VSLVGGLHVHRRQVTFDWVDRATGQAQRGQITPATREQLGRWLAQLPGNHGAFAVEACTGTTRRHRLSRGGDRHASAALHRIVIVRLRWHQPARDYLARRTAEGKTKKEILRCLIGRVFGGDSRRSRVVTAR
jgi:hypothetical protein